MQLGCPEVAFSKVGCLSLISASKPSFLSLTAGALEADACLYVKYNYSQFEDIHTH